MLVVLEQKQVRLVRACGSKLLFLFCFLCRLIGQARKSLWIETLYILQSFAEYIGQARKSLWIETARDLNPLIEAGRVRLVRACGSKPNMIYR